MGRFEVLPHTADVGFRAWGETLEDLFATAAMAMFNLEYDPASVPPVDSVRVGAGGDDLEGALFGWLSELIWLHDTEGFVPGEVRVDSITGVFEIRGTALGSLLGDWFVQTGPQLKAVTMHGLSVVRRAREYEATVYVDV